MQVCPVSNNQPAYKGYVGESLRSYINEAVSKECKNFVGKANISAQEVNPDMLKSIYEKGQSVIEKFQNFVKPLHKDTQVELSYSFLEFNNPITGRSISLYHNNSNLLNNDIWGSNQDIIWLKTCAQICEKSKFAELDKLEKIAEELKEKVKPQEIEGALLYLAEDSIPSTVRENGIGFFDRLKTKKHISKIEKYAKETNQTTNAREKAEECIKKIKAQKDLELRNQKAQTDLENKNRQIMENILKG